METECEAVKNALRVPKICEDVLMWMKPSRLSRSESGRHAGSGDGGADGKILYMYSGGSALAMIKITWIILELIFDFML